MNQNKPANFLDPKTLLAIAFLGLIWVGWQTYMQQKYPNYYKNSQQTESTAAQTEALGEVKTNNKNEILEASSTVKNDEVADPLITAEKTFEFEDENMAFELTSKGMGFNSLTLKKYTDREGELVAFERFEDTAPLETGLIGLNKKLDFNIEKVGKNRFVGTAFVDQLKVVKAIEVNTDEFLLNTEISVTGESDRFLGLEVAVIEPMKNIETSTFTPTFERQEFFVVNDGSDERVHVQKDDQVKESFPQVSVASVGTQYFTQALVDRSTVIPEFRLFNDATKAKGSLMYSALNKRSDLKIEYQAYLGPKDLDILEKIDRQLAGIIDFGFFSWLARPMLHLMKWFYQAVGNWGLSIILLTLLVRLIVLPFTVMSYKSLNKMKIIQPQIKALKEKHKEDPQRLNQEMMLLMKSNKVNPLGGCLPMLLQFPVFLALYQVLGQSIELYQAPFYFWITDLSLKDPYYVLPVLMAITMFIQQKITPNTMDPAQAKVMMFLPLVFALFMMSLPSGLTLYIFVSALFAILQQLIFMRDTNQTVATA